ncbi:MAG: hypothetical protein KIS92_13165 [Planctomycetota bacterium]|nr:hypothetical protein [Planctomycetota bacterium]
MRTYLFVLLSALTSACVSAEETKTPPPEQKPAKEVPFVPATLVKTEADGAVVLKAKAERWETDRREFGCEILENRETGEQRPNEYSVLTLKAGEQRYLVILGSTRQGCVIPLAPNVAYTFTLLPQKPNERSCQVLKVVDATGKQVFPAVPEAKLEKEEPFVPATLVKTNKDLSVVLQAKADAWPARPHVLGCDGMVGVEHFLLLLKAGDKTFQIEVGSTLDGQKVNLEPGRAYTFTLSRSNGPVSHAIIKVVDADGTQVYPKKDTSKP